MDLAALIDELDALLGHSVRLPATGKLLVNEEDIRRLVEQIKEAARDETQMGQRIAEEREQILAEARHEAQRMFEEAKTQLHNRIDEQGVLQAARERARHIIAEAERRAAQQQAQTNHYTSSQLGALENRLQRLLREVQAGQQFLASGSDERTKSSPQS